MKTSEEKWWMAPLLLIPKILRDGRGPYKKVGVVRRYYLWITIQQLIKSITKSQAKHRQPLVGYTISEVRAQKNVSFLPRNLSRRKDFGAIVKCSPAQQHASWIAFLPDTCSIPGGRAKPVHGSAPQLSTLRHTNSAFPTTELRFLREPVEHRSVNIAEFTLL